MSTVTARSLAGPAAWRGEDLARSADWIRAISAAEVGALEAALRAVEPAASPGVTSRARTSRSPDSPLRSRR